MPTQTTWRPWPFKNSKAFSKKLTPLYLIAMAQKTGCNVKPKSITKLSCNQLENIRAIIRNHIGALGLTDQLGVKRHARATYQITIYHRNQHAD